LKDIVEIVRHALANVPNDSSFVLEQAAAISSRWERGQFTVAHIDHTSFPHGFGFFVFGRLDVQSTNFVFPFRSVIWKVPRVPFLSSLKFPCPE